MTQDSVLPKLMVAPNGARRTKKDHPSIPITLEEIVETAVACSAAGADGLHLHVRDDFGAHTLDVGRYQEALAALHQAVPDIFLQVTSEAGGIFGADTQRAMIRTLKPASVSVALREMLRTPEDTGPAKAFYEWANNEGVHVQHIVYTPEECAWLFRCLDQGIILDRYLRLQFVIGSYDGRVISHPEQLLQYMGQIEARDDDRTYDWMVCAFGREETGCLSNAAAMGGKMRVGFENSIWNADGSFARDNAERVAEVRKVSEQVGSGIRMISTEEDLRKAATNREKESEHG